NLHLYNHSHLSAITVSLQVPTLILSPKNTPRLRLKNDLIAIDRVYREIDCPQQRPLSLPIRRIIARLQKPERPANSIDAEEIGIAAAAARPHVLIHRARARLIRRYAARVAGIAAAAPVDVAG